MLDDVSGTINTGPACSEFTCHWQLKMTFHVYRLLPLSLFLFINCIDLHVGPSTLFFPCIASFIIGFAVHHYCCAPYHRQVRTQGKLLSRYWPMSKTEYCTLGEHWDWGHLKEVRTSFVTESWGLWLGVHREPIWEVTVLCLRLNLVC